MNIRTASTTLRRALVAGLGVVSATLGLIGVFVPGLPTTVFAIAAAYLFARSAPGLEQRLWQNRWLGPSLRRFAETGGMTLRSKTFALASMWAGLAVSCLALAGVSVVLQATTIALGAVGTATILFYVRTISGLSEGCVLPAFAVERRNDGASHAA
jgi:uncharacterized membrane protein YbaN (DUF454 family)